MQSVDPCVGERPRLVADGSDVYMLSKEPVPASAIAASPLLQHLQGMAGGQRQLSFASADVRAWALGARQAGMR